MADDPRRQAVKAIIERIKWGTPKMYAGDWAGDTADRILEAIDQADRDHGDCPDARG